MTRAPQHVGHQRRSVAVLLGSWGVAGEPRDSVLVAISELLSNAVLYGISGTVGLCVAYDSFSGKAHIAVNDRTPGRQAERCRPDDDQEGGRGLLLVDALADVWGVSEDGCTTWCSIDVSSGDSQ
ncbi:ATP-binding protein [Streptomyces gelaticus]|uniref:ATP-binding protein n=1 Tax=Streptomyces gelaticus TaxID=285446 RepID=UPI00379BAF98